MFRAQSWAGKVAGLRALELPGLEDLDVSDVIAEHADYSTKLRTILERVGLDGPDDDARFRGAAAAARSAEL